MPVECVLINVERMEELRDRNNWSLLHEGAMGGVICLVGICEGPVFFTDQVIAAFLKTTVAKWIELRDDLIKHGALQLTEEGFVYLPDDGEFFKFRINGRKAIPSKIREAAQRRSKSSCSYCGTFEGPFHHDHLLPVSRGGGNEPSNVVLACRSCNSSKGDKTLLEWVAFLRAREGIQP